MKVTDVAVLTVPAVTVNVPVVAPDATVTLPGTVAAEVLELERATTTPPVPAACVRVTVPVPVWPLPMVAGLTETPLKAAGGGLTVTMNVAVRVE